MSSPGSLLILGTRGIPAAHGGFETFAERLALYMRDRGWNVTVYCQAQNPSSKLIEDNWNGIRRIMIPASPGPFGTISFDWKSVLHARKEAGAALVLGYNTAVFSALLRLGGRLLITNMDGIEWRRPKWSWPARAWLYINEVVGALTSSTLVADHPEIAAHLAPYRAKKSIRMIPYGGDRLDDAPTGLVEALGLTPGKYFLSIGRIEPENNLHLILSGYCSSPRNYPIVCLGKLTPEDSSYHKEIVQFRSTDVIFPGAIYDPALVSALRFHAAAYCHGHSVGGTNPSLVESLGAGNAIIAHENKFNRWVAGSEQFYFDTSEACARAFSAVESENSYTRNARAASRQRFLSSFQWPGILAQYEELFTSD